MKRINKIAATLAIGLMIGVSVPLTAQDMPPLPPAPNATDDTAPPASIPFGTGFDLLILLGGGFLAKKYKDNKNKKA